MNERYAFQHSFPHGIACAVLFEPAIHYDRQAKRVSLTKKWSPKPTDEEFESFFPEYIEWMHTVNAEVSEIIGSDHIYLVKDKYSEHPFWEAWVYHPNGERECFDKGEGFFE